MSPRRDKQYWEDAERHLRYLDERDRTRARTLAKAERRAERERELAAATIATNSKLAVSDQRYNVIYADPAWSFKPYDVVTGGDRAADNHYPCLDTVDIALMDVPAAKDCVLFLWATVPMLLDAVVVLKSWGFEYKSHWAWIKDKQGTGYWSRNLHELLLIGTRGKIPAPAPGTQPLSAMKFPVGRHSAKPIEFRQIIERLYPNVPKLEMFCREAAPGWDVHGNEVSEAA